MDPASYIIDLCEREDRGKSFLRLENYLYFTVPVFEDLINWFENNLNFWVGGGNSGGNSNNSGSGGGGSGWW